MSDREIPRSGLVLFALASLLLAACPKHPLMLCGAADDCPSGYVCAEGVCSPGTVEEPDACVEAYAYVDGECRLSCGEATTFADEAACCAAHPDACDDAIDSCPPSPPSTELVARVDLRCEYGEECCCGSCRPSMICSALAGEELGCFYSDWCLNPSCDNP